MPGASPLNPLTERQQNICEYGGTIGIFLSLTCLVQHFVVTTNYWITQAMIPFYLYALLSFSLLAFKKPIAPILIIVSGVLSIGIQWIWMKHLAFSLVVLCLFLYHVILVVSLFVEQIPQRLKEKRIAEIEEESKWAGKI